MAKLAETATGARVNTHINFLFAYTYIYDTEISNDEVVREGKYHICDWDGRIN